MASARSLSPVGQMYEDECLRAWDLWKTGHPEQAYNIARNLLVDPAVSKWHQASLHLLLGNSDDCYLEHAQRAWDMYKDMVDDPLPASPEAMAVRNKYLDMAEKVLKQATEDAANAQSAEVEDGAEVASESEDGDDDDMETLVDEDEEQEDEAPFNPDDWEPANDEDELDDVQEAESQG